jgi:hypothetical protein
VIGFPAANPHQFIPQLVLIHIQKAELELNIHLAVKLAVSARQIGIQYIKHSHFSTLYRLDFAPLPLRTFAFHILHFEACILPLETGYYF